MPQRPTSALTFFGCWRPTRRKEFSTDPAQAYIFLADGGNHRVHTLRRESLDVVSTFGRRGRWGGQFESPHSLAIDSKGNLFVAETLDGRRVQKFIPR